MSKIYIPSELFEENLNVYKILKVYSKMGYYIGLALSKIQEKIFVIKTTQDIWKNKLLFEIGGEIVSKDYLIKYKKELGSKALCYFKYCEGIEEESKLYILLREYANISFFLKETKIFKPNIIIKDFVNNENWTIILLCYSIKKIHKGEILLVDNKYVSLN